MLYDSKWLLTIKNLGKAFSLFFIIYDIICIGDFMHSGRGAKGSIGDRIISMLYRNRYKKYKLTKEQYLPDKKNKQIKYIKNLKEYQATNETIFLEREDKNI